MGERVRQSSYIIHSNVVTAPCTRCGIARSTRSLPTELLPPFLSSCFLFNMMWLSIPRRDGIERHAAFCFDQSGRCCFTCRDLHSCYCQRDGPTIAVLWLPRHCVQRNELVSRGIRQKVKPRFRNLHLLSRRNIQSWSEYMPIWLQRCC